MTEMAYVATVPGCECIVACVVDDPAHSRDTARDIAVWVRVTRPDGTALTLRLEHQLLYVLNHLPASSGAMASGTDVSPGTMAALRRRLKRVWEQEAGLSWPPTPGCWTVLR